MLANVFLTYAHKDEAFAERLRDSLARMGIEAAAVFPAVGSDWEEHLRTALDRSDAIVGVMTPAALDSAYVMQELGAAMMLDKPLVLVDPGVEPLPAIRMMNWQVLQGQDMTTDQIATQIRERLAA